MNRIELKEQKQIQVYILDLFVDFCKKHNLRYYLAYGTAIGAVRHKGYIPWDDDIDVCMPRPDYEQLIESFNKYYSNYKVISYKNKESYHLPFAKIHDINTLMIENKYKNVNYGVYIDVFPLDGVAFNCQITLCWLLRKILNCKRSVSGRGRNKRKDFLMNIAKIFLFPIKSRTIIVLMDRIGKIADYENSQYVESFFSTTTKKEKYYKAVFSKYLLQDFEGKKYRIPYDYHTYLSQQYGDYMKLPPIEKQVSHHDSEAWRL